MAVDRSDVTSVDLDRVEEDFEKCASQCLKPLGSCAVARSCLKVNYTLADYAHDAIRDAQYTEDAIVKVAATKTALSMAGNTIATINEMGFTLNECPGPGNDGSCSLSEDRQARLQGLFYAVAGNGYGGN